ncbi:hypothetical protein [Enterococcus cecorum]|uniref:HTH cro/C1-type domain-containing protein n=1 Tax=Enterococcus cecorum DSM 20682 = ATCC 43198 TaxID=1121864 RepID=S1RR39_9ENTE|nr:hypothetical protein [Enterococcus cecorum]EOX18992.1 hypothetical protein I567_00746 [Enterococcus cecorum DSM 20682 = ATCC 43198]ESK61278.1 hypothetical protein OMO_01338 [Enterococcus cecorum DSM 20682 = ATCC 43198]CAI3430912.1 helix-turn-helix transcriptional regulator [Enterococcus cecorum DSM 20682 = ATCC 43198]SQE56699.1 Uncharacterised protein [Enterococcus cecorum]
MEKDVIKIFWENVDWHRRNKGLNWKDLSFGQRTAKYRNGTQDIKLSTVQRIAEILDIDDYTILFERVDEQ